VVRLSKQQNYSVLGAAVKRLFFIVVAGLLFGALAYVALSALAHWIAPRFVRSDDDIGTLYLIWLVIQSLSVVAGGFLGNAIYRRSVA
jgi:hypothetical protein